MKEKIHPNYGQVLYLCASCGNEFVSQSTKLDGPKREYQAHEYPSVTLEICSQCHPFFSGKQMLLDTAGRVEKFNRRYGATMAARKAAEAAKTEAGTPPKQEAPAQQQPETAAAAGVGPTAGKPDRKPEKQ